VTKAGSRDQNQNPKPSPPDRVIRASAEPGGIVMKTAIENGPGVHELPLQHIRARIIEPNTLTINKSAF